MSLSLGLPSKLAASSARAVVASSAAAARTASAAMVRREPVQRCTTARKPCLGGETPQGSVNDFSVDLSVRRARSGRRRESQALRSGAGPGVAVRRRVDVPTCARARNGRRSSRARGYRGRPGTAAAPAGPESWSWRVMPASPARNTALGRMGQKKIKPMFRPLSCDTSRPPAATAGLISSSPSNHVSPTLMA